MNGFLKNKFKNSFCFKLSEAFTLNESYVIVVNENNYSSRKMLKNFENFPNTKTFSKIPQKGLFVIFQILSSKLKILAKNLDYPLREIQSIMYFLHSRFS
jgi:hypothetical protein